MTSRFARLCLAGLLSTSLVATRAQTPSAPAPQPPKTMPPAPVVAPAPAPTPLPTPPSATSAKTSSDDEPVSLKLPNADIDTVLSALEIYTGKIILRPAQLPTAPGGYNLEIARPIPKSQAVLYIETILAMNNIAVIPMGNDALKIVQLTMARVEAPELITGSTLELPPSSKVASKLFQLDFLRVQEFQQMLGTMTNPLFGQAVQLPSANAIVITDTVSNLQRIETLLKDIDRPILEGMMPKFYPLHHAKASDVVTKLHTILTGTVQQQLGMGTSYSADDRTNQVIVITDPREYPLFDQMIDKLDVESDPNTRNEVIYLKHAKSADVAKVLINIISGQTTANQKSQSVRQNSPLSPTPTPAPNVPGANPAPPQPTIVSGSSSANPNLDQGNTNEFSALATITNDDRSNSIVVSGTVDDIRLLKDLIDKLDIVLAQVRIEVVIAEVTLDDNHDSGISQLGLKLDGDRLVGFSGSGPSLSIGGTDSTSTTSTLASISRIGGPGSLARSLDLTALVSVNTTKRKNNTTILTVPAIVTSHGKQAIITDGETRPIITGVTSYAGTTSGATTSSQVQQTPIGTTLTVTPYIGTADGTVQLDLTQELTDVIDTVTVDGNTQYVIGNRKATSYITAKSGDVIVLAGFRKKIDSKQTNRLGPIPIIGDLLGQRHKDQYHQELVLFIRPTILTDNAAIDNAETLKNVDQLPTRDEIKSQLDPNYQPPKKHPILDKILPH